MRDRINNDDELRRQLQRKQRLFTGREFDLIENDLFDELLEIIRNVDPRAPESLTKILSERELVRVVRCDPAHPAADRERDLDHLVERRPVAGRAQCAVVLLLVDALQCRAGIENPAATRAQHVPRQLEDPEARGMQEGGNSAFFIDFGLAREIDHIDAAQVAIGRVPHQLLDHPGCFGIGRLPQKREQIAGFTHLRLLRQCGC